MLKQQLSASQPSQIQNPGAVANPKRLVIQSVRNNSIMHYAILHYFRCLILPNSFKEFEAEMFILTLYYKKRFIVRCKLNPPSSVYGDVINGFSIYQHLETFYSVLARLQQRVVTTAFFFLFKVVPHSLMNMTLQLDQFL